MVVDGVGVDCNVVDPLRQKPVLLDDHGQATLDLGNVSLLLLYDTPQLGLFLVVSGGVSRFYRSVQIAAKLGEFLFKLGDSFSHLLRLRLLPNHVQLPLFDGCFDLFLPLLFLFEHLFFDGVVLLGHPHDLGVFYVNLLGELFLHVVTLNDHPLVGLLPLLNPVDELLAICEAQRLGELLEVVDTRLEGLHDGYFFGVLLLEELFHLIFGFPKLGSELRHVAHNLGHAALLLIEKVGSFLFHSIDVELQISNAPLLLLELLLKVLNGAVQEVNLLL
mmetsp:Transcript_15067/g.41395  ORF Transcript_15067/g.41395 Transcript_15067/m.41395 type:complete len:276 (-) Transcript_15067:111-938(-)